jgi:hypothetical protein
MDTSAAPGLKRAAIMFNPDTAPVSAHIPFETAARSLKVTPIIAPVHTDAEIETAINALGHEPGNGLVVMTDLFTIGHRDRTRAGNGPHGNTDRLPRTAGPQPFYGPSTVPRCS